jgi:chemotaxis response regulator CheB
MIPMTDTPSEKMPKPLRIQSALTSTAEDADLSKRELVERVAHQEEAPVEAVRNSLHELVRSGEVYLVGDGDQAEVRRT